MPLDRQDIVLLLAEGAEQGRYPFDPIRIMKGCFIVSEIGTAEMRAQFSFRPYDYGPFDASVYRARDALVGKGFLRANASGRYSSYSLTDEGRQRAADLQRRLSSREHDWLLRVGHWVTSKSFTELLDEIYDRFPQYATRSVMR